MDVVWKKPTHYKLTSVTGPGRVKAAPICVFQHKTGYSHFRSDQFFTLASVSCFSSFSNSDAGTALKVKQLLPCIRFFKSGKMSLFNSEHMYSGIR